MTITKLNQLATKIAQVRKAITAFVASGIGVVIAFETLGESQGWGTTGLSAGVISIATALGVWATTNKPSE